MNARATARCILAICLSAGLGAGCRSSAGNSPPDSSDLRNSEATALKAAPLVGAKRVASADGTFWVHFIPPPKKFPFNEAFDLEVRITSDEKGQTPIAAHALVVDARMPEHRHGMVVTPKVTRTGVGAFQVEGLLLHMDGFWELYFDVTRRGITDRAQLRVDLE
ncbi:MAG: hypothetical protein ACKVX7_18320 [Planctomycetota bacterium]